MSNFETVSYAQHFISLKFCPLSSNGSGKLQKNNFYWNFNIKPFTFSKIYHISLKWNFNDVSPKVYILNQEVHEVAKKKTIPHLYCQKKIELCLYYPSSNGFSSEIPLCNTIISWTHLWISYYEDWLHSGEWKGGGIHP
jgi:hypothetical protein